MSKKDGATTGMTWVVVADASRAEIYERRKRFSELEVVRSLTEPGARAREQELATDGPGRAFDSGGRGRHAMEPNHTGKQHLRETFAHRIAEMLESARSANEFEHLVLVASPALLGELRAQLSKTLRRQVRDEIDKHMTGEEPATIAALIDGERR